MQCKCALFIDYVQDRFLAFPPEQHPIVLQIGGNNLENISKATQLANAYGYDEINLKLVPHTGYVSFWLRLLYCFICSICFISPIKNLTPSLPFFSCGCPSPRVVGHGCFGARLMLDPKVWQHSYWI